MICDRPRCTKPTTGDLLYCSDRCYELDNDPTPITALARSKTAGDGGSGKFVHWGSDLVPVILPGALDTPRAEG